MIHRRDNIAMTAYVLTQEARSPAIPATEMRVNNQRMGAGRRGIPDLTLKLVNMMCGRNGKRRNNSRGRTVQPETWI